MRRLKKGQVWVETVIYTLIGLAVIGLVLAAALPKINERKDEIMIEQSIQSLGNINDKIYEVINRGATNRRVIDLYVMSGALVIDMGEDTISWELESSYRRSQEDMWVPEGVVDVMTTVGNPWKVTLRMSYEVDLRVDGSNEGTHRIGVSPTPYSFVIENAEKDDGNIVIDLSES